MRLHQRLDGSLLVHSSVMSFGSNGMDSVASNPDTLYRNLALPPSVCVQSDFSQLRAGRKPAISRSTLLATKRQSSSQSRGKRNTSFTVSIHCS